MAPRMIQGERNLGSPVSVRTLMALQLDSATGTGRTAPVILLSDTSIFVSPLLTVVICVASTCSDLRYGQDGDSARRACLSAVVPEL